MNNQWYVYFLIQNKKIVYVGMSYKMQSRLMSHLKDKQFTSIRWIACKSKRRAAKYERRWILRFIPKYNKDTFVTSKRRKMGLIKKYLPESSRDLLRHIKKETGVPIRELLKDPLADAFYVYEKYKP